MLVVEAFFPAEGTDGPTYTFTLSMPSLLMQIPVYTTLYAHYTYVQTRIHDSLAVGMEGCFVHSCHEILGSLSALRGLVRKVLALARTTGSCMYVIVLPANLYPVLEL